MVFVTSRRALLEGTFALAVSGAEGAIAEPSHAGGAAAPTAILPFLVGLNADGNERFFGATSWPTEAGLAYYLGKGLNVFRLPFLWENLDPKHSGAITHLANLASIKAIVAQVSAAGGFLILDCHESLHWQPADYATTGAMLDARDSAGTLVTGAQFADFWAALANVFKTEPRVIFEIANEPYSVDATLLVKLTNQAIAAIAATGAQNHVMVDGTNFTAPYNWTGRFDDGSTGGAAGYRNNAEAMLDIVDPRGSGKLLFDIHQYVDGKGGTVPTAVVNCAAGVLANVTSWARQHGKRLFFGEFGGGDNEPAMSETFVMADHVAANQDVWAGMAMWAAFVGQFYKNQGDTADTFFFNVDPIIDRQARQGKSLVPPSPSDWDGSRGVAEDPRLTRLRSYAAPARPFIIDDLGASKVLCHLNPFANVSPARWADGSGNGNDFVQNASGAQPRVDATNGGLAITAGRGMACASLTAAGTDCAFQGFIAADMLTVTAVQSGSLAAGDILMASRLPSTPPLMPRTQVLAQESGAAGGLGTYRLSNAQTFGTPGAPAPMASAACQFTGAIVGDVLTVAEVSSGTLKVGQTFGCSQHPIVVAIGTTILAQLSGAPGGSGTYRINYPQAVLRKAMTAAGGAARYNLYLVVLTAAGAAGPLSLVSSAPASGGIDLRVAGDGKLVLNDHNNASLGPANPSAIGTVTPGRKTLVVLRLSTSSFNMALSLDGRNEAPYASNGYSPNGFTGSAHLQLGSSPGADDPHPFTLCEVVIADGTKLTTQDHQKIMGALMRAHAIPSGPGAIYGLAAPRAS